MKGLRGWPLLSRAAAALRHANVKWHATPLRTQLVGIILSLLLISLIATGMGTLSLLKASLIERIDPELTSTSRSLVNQLVQDSRTRSTTTVRTLPSNYAVLVYDSTGQFMRSYLPSFGSGDSPDPDALQSEDLQALRGETFTMPGAHRDGSAWRATIEQIPGSYKTYVIAQNLQSVQNLTNQAAMLIFGVSGIVVVVALFIAYFLVTRAFRPLKKVETTAGAIAAGDLSQRVRVESPHTEIGTLGTALNFMLSQIETSFENQKKSEEKMRRFVADASHELRTPLVTIRGFSEMYLKGMISSPEDVKSAMTRMESEAIRMGDLVEDLLMLARLDEQRPMRIQNIDLRMLALDAMTDAKVTVPDRPFTVVGLNHPLPESALVDGDDTKLRQVVSNLLTNAYRYTPDGSPIEVAVGVGEEDGHRMGILEIRDHGPGIPQKEKDKIFDRFYRTDTSRARVSGGNGLGLAIVQAIVAAHRGKVTVRDTPGGGATFSMSLPLAAPTPEKAPPKTSIQ